MSAPLAFPDLPQPNLLDRLVTQVSPERGLRRLRARALLQMAGGYSGARADSRALREWYAKMGSADSDTLGDLDTLRQRSSDLRRNTPLATGTFRSYRDGVVGLGIRPQPRIDRELLGISEEEAARFEADAIRLWSWWAETTACDAAGRIDHYTQQALVLMAQMERGDAIAVRRFKADQGRALGLAVQLFEGDYCSNPNGMADTERRKAGIEFDELGEPVTYWLSNRHPADGFLLGPLTWKPISAVAPESGERQVLHIFEPLRTNQSRGVPMLAPVIELMRQLGVYVNAELMATVLSSFFTVFVKQNNLTEPTGLAMNAGQTIANRDGEYKLGQGAIVSLGEGEDIEIANPNRPNTALDPFMQALACFIGAGVGLPAEVLLKRFNASYSASRGAFLEAFRGYLRYRRELVAQFSAPCYDWLIAEAVARGILRAPGFFDNPLIRRAWTDATWTGDAPGQLDEESAVQAAILRINAGLSTLEEETRKLTGGDWEQNHVQQVKERKARVAAGLDVEPVAERIVTQPQEPVRSPDNRDQADDGSTPSQQQRRVTRSARERLQALVGV